MDRPRSQGQGGGKQQPNKPARTTDNLAAVANRLRTPMYVSDRAMPREDETIRAIETRLQIAHVGDQSEESFVMSNCGPDGLCTDASFPPGPSSLYPDPSQLPATAVGPTTWRRISGTLYVPSNRTPKLLPGGLPNQPLLGALAALAVRQGLLLDLIVSDDHANQGAYTFQFYKHGCWHQVTVDNFLPCIEGQERLAFACSSNEGELWPSLMEKAYAKVHGSYHALEGGSIGDVLVDLTGGVATKVKLEGTDPAAAGSVWDDLLGWLNCGSIVVCKAKAQGEDTAGPSGLQRGLQYSVIDARKLDAGTRLVRLQCPWPSGLWNGPWSSGSQEWSSPAAQAHMQHFAPTLQDDATFWMNFTDFVSFFDRLHVCRLFPPSWHQLTLHCGWQGPSAGGPYFAHLGERDGEFIMGQSSTWCCNPQFRITVRKACEVLVCLGQQDPRIEYRRHVRKQMRRKSIGLQVLRLPLSSLGRRWEVKGNELLQEIPLMVGREACTTFKAEPDYAYIVVPYAGRAGDEGAFVLRTFSSAPLEMEQLPSPLSLVLGGHWVGYLAGGSRHCPTFGSNPQYMISCQHRTPVVLSVSRLDVRYSILKPAYKKEQCVGLLVLEPEKGGAEGGLRRCTSVRDEQQVRAECGFTSMEEAVAMFMLEPETPYVVVPCLVDAGIEAPFELRIMSGVPIELVPLPEVKCVVAAGEWKEDNSGGCDLNPVWKKNPRYLLTLSGQARVRITMTRLPKPGKKLASSTTGVDDMIGFYVLKCSEPNGEIKGDLRRAVIHETAFVPVIESSADLELQAGAAYVVMPCTYSPGRLGRFSLAVTSSLDFDFTELHHTHHGTHNGHHHH